MKLRNRQSEYTSSLRTVEGVAHEPKPQRKYEYGSAGRTLDEALPQLIQMSTGEGWFRDSSWPQNLSTLAFYITVFPELRRQIGLDDKNFEDFQIRLQEWAAGDTEWFGRNMEGTLEAAANLYLCSPERRGQMTEVDDLQDRFLSVADHNNVDCKDRMRAIRNFCLLFPDRRTEVIEDEEVIIKRWKSVLPVLIKSNRWDLYARTLADAFVVFPHLKKEIVIDDETMEKIDAALLHRFQATKKYSENIAEIEWMRAVLYANEIQVGQNGIELIDKSQFEQGPALPERKMA